MSLAHVYDRPAVPTPHRRQTVLVTGAAGNIGRYFAEHAAQRYDLRLMVHECNEDTEPLKRYGELVEADVTDLAPMKRVCGGVDSVLHLAADPSPEATWSTVRDVNIAGTYHVAVAAKAAGCRRLVYASSIHAVSGHPVTRQVQIDDPVNPGDLYGVSKCFGEAMCRYMAEQEGLSCIAVRIGAFQPESVADDHDALGMADAWVSPRDLFDLLCRCLDAENLRFAIVHGLSDNRFNRMDITATQDLLGYAPQDDFTEVHPALRKLDLAEKVSGHDQEDGKRSGIREEV
jgi:NAD(P)-dependent dehydrogenase (short-subunit alcohol dehydrogenase family)